MTDGRRVEVVSQRDGIGEFGVGAELPTMSAVMSVAERTVEASSATVDDRHDGSRFDSAGFVVKPSGFGDCGEEEDFTVGGRVRQPRCLVAHAEETPGLLEI